MTMKFAQVGIVALGMLAMLWLPTAAWAFCPPFCVTGDQMSNIRAGMTKAQVIVVLGQPDGYARAGSTEALTYTNRLMSGFSWDRADYQVILTSGVVTSYGPGTVRQNSAPGNFGTLILIPLR
jgi:hypothetical protein